VNTDHVVVEVDGRLTNSWEACLSRMKEEYTAPNVQLLYDIANKLRIDGVKATDASKSG